VIAGTAVTLLVTHTAANTRSITALVGGNRLAHSAAAHKRTYNIVVTPIDDDDDDAAIRAYRSRSARRAHRIACAQPFSHSAIQPWLPPAINQACVPVQLPVSTVLRIAYDTGTRSSTRPRSSTRMPATVCLIADS
jgi:hypothetical protein